MNQDWDRVGGGDAQEAKEERDLVLIEYSLCMKY